MNTKTKVISGFILGAAVGSVAALLLAPSSGKKTRKMIKEESRRLADEAIAKANDSLKTAKKAFDRKLDTYTRKGEAHVEHLSDVMNDN